MCIRRLYYGIDAKYIIQPQNSVVEKVSSVRNQRLNKEHEKWLRGMGIDEARKPKSEKLALSRRLVLRDIGV